MKNQRFREYRSGHRQFLLNQAAELEVRQQEERTEVQQLAVKQGWTLEELDEFCREMFGYTLVAIEPRYLHAVWHHFKARDGTQ